MPDPTITYFPVSNGDTCLLKLADKTTFLIDMNVTEAGGDPEDPSRYDVHAHLLKELRSDADGRPHLDAFLLTHPDQDHLRGVPSVFYLGDPTGYSKNDKEDGRILVDELWFAPRIFWPWEEKDLSEDAKAFKKEADRRIAVFRKGGKERTVAGNRIRVIGYTDNPDLAGLEAIVTVPGGTISLINGRAQQTFEFFVHAPFRKDTDAKWQERNDTSIVLQARFTVDGQDRAALALLGGDARCAIWEAILEKSQAEDVAWDLFLAPHHCSWTFFSELPSEDNEPSKNILNFLEDGHREGAFVVSSSKPIKDDEDNPPHYQAAKLYRKSVGEDRFFCTGEHPNEKKPEPLYFRMTKNGPQKDDFSLGSQIVSSAALKATVTTPKTYGR